MSEAESPQRTAPEHHVSVEDVRILMGASTPHFALQIRARIAKLIDRLPPDDPARVIGEHEMDRLRELALRGEAGDPDGHDDLRPLPSLTI